MEIFKFGGASLKSSGAIMNMERIISRFGSKNLVIVVSAMGKTTNALETIFSKARNRDNYDPEIESLGNYHLTIGMELFGSEQKAGEIIEPVMTLLKESLGNCHGVADYDEAYDSIIPYGELLSSAIVFNYLKSRGSNITLLDARDLITTDELFRDANILWDITCQKIENAISPSTDRQFITQGFIGRSESGRMTTLGREGSDFTAAIFGNCLSADAVTIWKDVPGILNADPKRMSGVSLFSHLTYQEIAEMSYYGASVVHPRTIKPLADKNIPLQVRSFEDPESEGTLIGPGSGHTLPPSFIVKERQCLISFTKRNLEFINERNLGKIFYILDQLNIRLNLMQNSAVSFSICINQDASRVKRLHDLLTDEFRILYNDDLMLITVKNHTQNAIDTVSKGLEILLEQRTRNTYQIVVRNDQA